MGSACSASVIIYAKFNKRIHVIKYTNKISTRFKAIHCLLVYVQWSFSKNDICSWICSWIIYNVEMPVEVIRFTSWSDPLTSLPKTHVQVIIDGIVIKVDLDLYGQCFDIVNEMATTTSHSCHMKLCNMCAAWNMATTVSLSSCNDGFQFVIVPFLDCECKWYTNVQNLYSVTFVTLYKK